MASRTDTTHHTLHWQDVAEELSAMILSGSDVDTRSTTIAGIGIHRKTPSDVNAISVRERIQNDKGFPS